MSERGVCARRGGLTQRNRDWSGERRLARSVIGAFCAAAAGGVLFVAAEAAPAGVITPPEEDFEWAVVGDLGNRPLDQSDVMNIHVEGLGRVDRFYRISKTVVTAGQWLEFLQAYAPFVEQSSFPDNPASGRLTGISISMENFPPEPGKVPQYKIGNGVDPNIPALGMIWRNAARYINWLHNDKAITLDAFEGGVYDLTQCDQSDCFPLNEHASNARFWIPTDDEFIKAAYWDPHKNGPGQGGYWQYPDGGDEPLVSGLPGEPGAETQAGPALVEFFQALPVGSYPNTQSPWGLLDVPGGGNQFTETFRFATRRLAVGSVPGDDQWIVNDSLMGINPGGFLNSIRVATAIPAPGTLIPFTLALLVAGPRRRRD